MIKEKRQQKILSLIQGKPIATQLELADYLRRAGFDVTQSSVSRDIEELGIIKQQGRYVVPARSAVQSGLLSVETAGDALLVARCEPGLASAVAVTIDRAHLPEVVGTLAGEDTIFIAVPERKTQRAALKKIWQLFE